MAKLFVSSNQINDKEVVIEGDDAHHLISVLRIKVGDFIEIACKGETFKVKVSAINSGQVVGQIYKRVSSNNESPLYTRLFQGVAKGDKMDFVIQKAVELGVNEIVPFMSRYTIVRLDQKKRKKRKIRWERIAKEAAKQCQRDVVPIISDVIDFSEVVIKVGSKQKEELVIMPWELANSNGLKEIKTYSPKIVSVIIGPEGGFSEDEVSQIKQVNGIIISLGPRILRTETAGLVTLALAEYRWGDLGITMEG